MKILKKAHDLHLWCWLAFPLELSELSIESHVGGDSDEELPEANLMRRNIVSHSRAQGLRPYSGLQVLIFAKAVLN